MPVLNTIESSFSIQSQEPSPEASVFNRELGLVDDREKAPKVEPVTTPKTDPKTAPKTAAKSTAKTAPLTVQERQEKLDQLASIDPAVLAHTTVKELRTLTAGLIDRKSIATGKDKNKVELVLAIQELVQPTRERIEQERQLEIAKKEAEALELLAATRTPTAQAVRETLKEKWVSLTPAQHAKNILDVLETVVSDLKTNNEAKLVKIGMIAHDFVQTMLKRDKVTTVRTNLSDTRKELKTQLADRVNSLHYENLVEAEDQFRQALSISFEPYQKAYNSERKAKVVEASNNQVAIDVQPLLAKATDVLNKIADGLPVDHLNTALAIATVTGRRLSEVFGTRTEMTAIDYKTVAFKGQLKVKDDVLRRDLVLNIPTLVDSSLVISALTYLRSLRDKNNESYCLEDPEAIKKKYGKPVSRAIEKYGWDSVYSELTFKTLRDIYALVCLQNKPKNMSPNAYVGSILGHDPNQLETASVYQKFYLVGGVN